MYKESIRLAVRLQNSSPTRKTYRLLFARRRAKVFQKRDEVGEMFSDDASGKREREREREREKKIAKRNVNENAPIIQNAVKTPTPPHCANCFTFATVGTMSTFDAAQCWRGMKDLSTSLMCFSCVYLIRVILCGFHVSLLKAIFPQHLGFQFMMQNPKHERSRFFTYPNSRVRVCSSNKERRLLRTRSSQTAKEEEETVVVIIK